MRFRGVVPVVLVGLLLLLIVSSSSVARAQEIEYRKMWTVALKVTEITTGQSTVVRTEPRMAVLFFKEKIVVYSKDFQQYEFVSEAVVRNNAKQWSSSWTCVDAKGRRATVTFGIVQKTKEVQLQVEYSDFIWVYLLQ